MNYRKRHRVDWDEEIRKTERIRRKGLFISALGFGLAVLFIVGLNRTGVGIADVARKLFFALFFILSMFLMRIVWRRRERLELEKREKEQEEIIERMRLDAQKREE
jgi:membrane protein implicated in regulation of membrane protease activity